MASPQRLTATLRAISPRPLQSIRRQFLSPRSPDRYINKTCIDSENRLAPFNIDTPNRRKILKDGLPHEHRTVLGSGGFGTVYKAFYKGDQVAAKVIQKQKCSDAVINSEKHAAFLRHSNIVRVLTIEQGATLSLIAMELCGKTLQDRLEDGALTKAEQVRVLRDITCALEFCHDAGIVHADVKAKNILIAADGQPKLTDFGSSVLMSDTQNTNIVHGTPGYVAPEVLKGNPPTSAADIYSLAIVAWQMLSRILPFFGLHIHAIIYLSAKGMRPRDDDIDDNFHGKYKALYRKMWSQNIMDRPTTIEILNRVDSLILNL